jgi:hypothetical protein
MIATWFRKTFFWVGCKAHDVPDVSLSEQLCGVALESEELACPIFIATVVGDCVRCGHCAALIPR